MTDAYHRSHGFNVPPELQDTESGDNAGQWVVLPEPEYSRHAEHRGQIENITIPPRNDVFPSTDAE